MDTTRFLIDFLQDCDSDTQRSERMGFMFDIATHFWTIKNNILQSFYEELAAELKNDFPDTEYVFRFSKNANIRYSNICIWKPSWERKPLRTSEDTDGLVCYCIQADSPYLSDICYGIAFCSNKTQKEQFKKSRSITISGQNQDDPWWLKYLRTDIYQSTKNKTFLMQYATKEGKQQIFEYHKNNLVVLRDKLETALDEDVKNYAELS